MESKKMMCFRCKEPILPNENYFIMTEMNQKEKVKVDYVHRDCWDKFIKQLDGASYSLRKSNYLLDAMGSQMRKMGMIPDKEVII